jgi:hypothetical protein
MKTFSHARKSAHKSFSVLVCAIAASCAVCSLALSADIPTIPTKGEGVLVDAICGRGCAEPRQSCAVYVLSEKEYDDHQDKDTKIESKGKTPLLLRGLKPGVYYVGVDAPVNTSDVPKSGGGFTPLKPDYQKFFADDQPEAMSHVLSSVPAVTPSGATAFRVVFTFRKWYKITVDEHGITPLGALFLAKDDSLSDWKQFYPTAERFKIVPDKDFQQEFLDAVTRFAGTAITDRDLFLTLLKRGGRVSVPQASNPTVVFLNSKGLPEARNTIRAGADKPPQEVVAFSPNRPVALPQSRPQTENQQRAGLPKFTTELKGGNEVRIRNPNEFSVQAALRSAAQGKDFNVPAKGSNSVFVPDGAYEIYFVYSNEPGALYRGDSFVLRQNGVEIQIVQVVGGNYSIHRVK